MSRRQPKTRSTPSGDAPGSFLGLAAADWIALAFIAVALVVVYHPAMNGGLLWDDEAHVTPAELRSWHGLYRIWTDPEAAQQYYPLLHSMFWVEYRLWGGQVAAYHWVNLVEHLVATGLLLLILRRLKIPGASLAAAIFALHPVNVESVAWISEQKNTLSAVFYLSAMLVYLKFDETWRSVDVESAALTSEQKNTLLVVFYLNVKLWYLKFVKTRQWKYYGLAVALFVLGLLTKTVIATLPAALLVVFWWQRGTLSWRRDVAPLVPWFVLGVVAGLVTAWVERTIIGASGEGFEFTLLQRSLLAGRVLCFYVSKLFWPANLMFIYPRWEVDPAVWWQWTFSVACILLTVGLWLARKWSRAPLTGWLFFVGTLFPVLGFLNVFPFIFSFVANHFIYLASLGIIVPVSAGLVLAIGQLVERWVQADRQQQILRLGFGAGVVLVVVLAVLAQQQARTYADGATLYRATIEKNPDCWMACNNLGAILRRRGEDEAAIEVLKQAVKLRPNYGQAYNNLGLVYMALNKPQEAIEFYTRAIETDPNNPDFRNNFGIALGNMGKADAAMEQFQAALETNPNFVRARMNLGSALAQKRQPREAIEQLKMVLEVDPDYALAHMNAAIAYDELNDQQQATAEASTALQLAKRQGDVELAGRIAGWLQAHLPQNTQDTTDSEKKTAP